MLLPSNSCWRSLFAISKKHNIKVSNTGTYYPTITIIDDGGDPASDQVRTKRFDAISDQNGLQFKASWHYEMREDSKGNMWLCTADGVLYFDPSKAFDDDFRGTRPTLSDGTVLLEGIDVNSMCEDAQGHFWFGTNTQGLYEVSADCKQILNHYTPDNSYLPDVKVISVCAKPDGSTIYAGTDNGLCEFNRGVTPGESDYSRVTITPANVPAGYTGFVTQLFYDNAAYFRFVEKARKAGITVPIIPGIKPLAKLSQLTVVPKTFHCDIPEALASEALKCRTDEELKQVGIEWGEQQCRELIAKGVPGIHFYTVSAVDSICEIAKRVF